MDLSVSPTKKQKLYFWYFIFLTVKWCESYLRMADDSLIFVCIQCGHGCSTYEDLTEHMEDHEDQKPDMHQLRRGARFSTRIKNKKTKQNNDLSLEVCYFAYVFFNLKTFQQFETFLCWKIVQLFWVFVGCLNICLWISNWLSWSCLP